MPAPTTTTSVVTTIKSAALRTDAGSRRNRAIRCSIGFGRETVGIPDTHAHRPVDTTRKPSRTWLCVRRRISPCVRGIEWVEAV